jgi:hypothetical protein
MSVLVIVVIAVYACIDQLTRKVSGYCLIRVAFSACAHLDACLRESVLGTLSHSAADKHIYIAVLQKPCKSLMTYTV